MVPPMSDVSDTRNTPFRLRALQRRVYEVLEVAAPGDRLSRLADLALLGVIGVNVLTLVLGTVDSLAHRISWLFFGVELLSVLLFSVEYVFRMWSCTVDPRYAHPIKGRLRFALTPLSLIDLAGILPFYLPFLGFDLRAVWALRLFRLLRVAKLVRYSSALQTFSRVIRSKREALVLSAAFVSVLILIASSLIYYAEHDAQPKVFSSIPASMWWAVVTLSTVGYGDMYPITALGRAIAGFVAVLGIGMFAIPTGILGAAFVEESEKKRREGRRCKHCGEPLDD